MSLQPPNPLSPADGTPTPPPPPSSPPIPLPSNAAPLGVSVSSPPIPGYRPPPRPAGLSGRHYGFFCTYCSSRLEAVESLAGQTGTCPTCGNAIIIPILDYRGRLIDPTSGEVIKQDPHPVHAYAAAGHKAPQIIAVQNSEERLIRCPRCQRNNSLSCNNCQHCGLPFTMEGTVGDAVSGGNSKAVVSLVLGIVSILGGFFFVFPPLLAIVFGILALQTPSSSTGRTTGSGLAIAGLILGTLGVIGAIFIWSRILGLL